VRASDDVTNGTNLSRRAVSFGRIIVSEQFRLFPVDGCPSDELAQVGPGFLEQPKVLLLRAHGKALW
jgi:hypothetical protein